MTYLVNNSYGATPENAKAPLSLDQRNDDKRPLVDTISETDEDYLWRRKVFEIKSIIAKNDNYFTGQESALLNFILDGYTLAELEHSGVMKKSTLYLTFNTAVDKLQIVLKTTKRNKH